MQLSSLCYQAASSSRRAGISQTGHGGLDSIGGSTAMHSCILHIVLMNKSRVLSICRVGPRQGPRVPQASTTLAAVGSVKGPGSLGSGRGTISHWVWRGGGEHSRSKAKEIDRKSQGKMVLLEGKYWRTKACKNMCILRRCQTKPFTAQHHASFLHKSEARSWTTSCRYCPHLSEGKSLHISKHFTKLSKNHCKCDTGLPSIQQAAFQELRGFRWQL